MIALSWGPRTEQNKATTPGTRDQVWGQHRCGGGVEEGAHTTRTGEINTGTHAQCGDTAVHFTGSSWRADPRSSRDREETLFSVPLCVSRT